MNIQIGDDYCSNFPVGLVVEFLARHSNEPPTTSLVYRPALGLSRAVEIKSNVTQLLIYFLFKIYNCIVYKAATLSLEHDQTMSPAPLPTPLLHPQDLVRAPRNSLYTHCWEMFCVFFSVSWCPSPRDTYKQNCCLF